MSPFTVRKSVLFTVLLFLCLVRFSARGRESGLALAVFDVDATPPVGSELAYQTMVNSGELSLRARGVILIGSGKPIVLCSVDWIGIANGSQDAFKQALAEAAGTDPDRVEVHTVHQHDAPICDFTAENMLKEKGLPLDGFDGTFARTLLVNLRAAVTGAMPLARPVTRIGLGKAEVRKVASNRTVRKKDGTFDTRYSSEPVRTEFRKLPEGRVDRELSMVSFWDDEEPLAILTFYATHPQSYYLTGVANPDFPGLARYMEQLRHPDALFVHFNGAGGNIAAGKYNDGSHEMRLVLAKRLAEGMEKAWRKTKKFPVTSKDIAWFEEPMLLPYNHTFERKEENLPGMERNARSNGLPPLAWCKRRREGKSLHAACLAIGDKARILFMPGELFVEYQLAAKKMASEKFVAMAAYGDYGPFYIGTKEAFSRGGYEVRSSPVAPEAEDYILDILDRLLNRAGPELSAPVSSRR